jgi:hypothetical protein
LANEDKPEEPNNAADKARENEYWDNMVQNHEPRSQALQRALDQSEQHFEDMLEEGESTDRYMQDPQDFTDVTAVAKKRKLIKILSITGASLIVLVVGGYLGATAFFNDTSLTSETTKNEEVKVNPDGSIQKNERNRPLLDAFPNAPKVGAGTTTVEVKKDTIVSSTGYSLTIKNQKLIQSETDCEANAPTDFCFAARTEIQVDETATQSETTEETAETSSNINELNVYFFKDAAHSRIFENPEDFKKIEVPGASTAGIMTVDLAGDTSPTIVVVNNNSSGFMITLMGDSTLAEAEKLAATLSVKSK